MFLLLETVDCIVHIKGVLLQHARIDEQLLESFSSAVDSQMSEVQNLIYGNKHEFSDNTKETKCNVQSEVNHNSEMSSTHQK